MRRMNYVWSVTITTFLDDYKARGSDWADVSIPVLFEDEDDAFLHAEEALRAKMSGQFDDEPPSSSSEFWVWFDVKNKGEFVPHRYDYRIDEIEVIPSSKNKRRRTSSSSQ